MRRRRRGGLEAEYLPVSPRISCPRSGTSPRISLPPYLPVSGSTEPRSGVHVHVFQLALLAGDRGRWGEIGGDRGR